MTRQFVAVEDLRRIERTRVLRAPTVDIASYGNLRRLGMQLMEYLTPRQWQSLARREARSAKAARHPQRKLLSVAA